MAPEALWALLHATGGQPEAAAGCDIAYNLPGVVSYHPAKFQLNQSTGVQAYSGHTHTQTHRHGHLYIYET